MISQLFLCDEPVSTKTNSFKMYMPAFTWEISTKTQHSNDDDDDDDEASITNDRTNRVERHFSKVVIVSLGKRQLLGNFRVAEAEGGGGELVGDVGVDGGVVAALVGAQQVVAEGFTAEDDLQVLLVRDVLPHGDDEATRLLRT